VIARLADPTIRIVSLTITEGGYSIDDITGRFDPTTADVARDLERAAPPRSVFGLITAGLAQRRASGQPPFAVVSCDNLQGNGELTRRVFSGSRASSTRARRVDWRGLSFRARWSTE
jgi:mannitol 2-dehydrogenase